MEKPIQPECVLVLPAYNEAACIREVIGEWIETLDRILGRSFLILAVNDGSRDSTHAILESMAQTEERLVVLDQPNAGHGSAVLHGYRKAISLGASYVFQVDSDGQFDPRDFKKLWDRRAQSSFILGRRLVRNDDFHRVFITQVLKRAVSLLFDVEIADSNIPFRLMKSSFLNWQLSRLPFAPFAPNLFLSVIAARNGESLLNLPVTHRRRLTGKSSIARVRLARVCLRSFWELLRFRASFADKSSSSMRTEATCGLGSEFALKLAEDQKTGRAVPKAHRGT